MLLQGWAPGPESWLGKRRLNEQPGGFTLVPVVSGIPLGSSSVSDAPLRTTLPHLLG